jgi:hypothetical protein
MLIDPASAGIPAPFWFVQFFTWLGFTLHMVPMNLWYAGLLVALWLHLRGDQHARQFAARLLQQMPVIVALGVNFGVVPLLFLQLAYYKVFYPATILMACFWLAIIVLLIPAYYGVYAYALGLSNSGDYPVSRRGKNGTVSLGAASGTGMAGWRRAAGWVSALLFICIGFTFANGMSLMEHVPRWLELWNAYSTAAAATGTALNVGDPTLWPRWLLMFGLALGTTAVWVLVDAVFLIRRPCGAGVSPAEGGRAVPTARAGKTPAPQSGGTADEAYQAWAWGFARRLYSVAMLWAAAAGAWYVFHAWPANLRDTMFQWPMILLTVATAVAPGLPWLLMMTAGLCSAKRATVAAIAFSQFGVLGINAVSRQIVQNINLKPFLDVSAQPTDVQWGPLAMFVIVFVLGLAVVGWMIAQIVKCKPKKG